jgi:periplasmic protein TonB
MPTIEQVELEKPSFGAPAIGSLALHVGIAGAFLALAYINGHLHRDMWGSNEKQGAIQATLVSNAPAIPLPQVVPPTPNVLATETPSPAPAPEAPQPKAAPVPDEKAIPIPVKQPPKVKEPPKKQAAEKPSPKPPTNEKAAQHPQPTPTQPNRAQYGQGAPQMARSMASNQGPQSPVQIKGGATGFQYGWYVEVITRKVRQNWYPSEAPPGTETDVSFVVDRSGHPSNVRIEKSSGNASYDSSGVRAVQRVDTFGPLPAGYNQSTLIVTYTFSTSTDGPGR